MSHKSSSRQLKIQLCAFLAEQSIIHRNIHHIGNVHSHSVSCYNLFNAFSIQKHCNLFGLSLSVNPEFLFISKIAISIWNAIKKKLNQVLKTEKIPAYATINSVHSVFFQSVSLLGNPLHVNFVHFSCI